MKLARRIVVACCGTALFGVMVASASLMPVSSARVGAGDSPVAACDTDGVSAAYTNAFNPTVGDYETTAITVSGIAPSCVGRSGRLTVRGAGGLALWQASAAITGTSITVATTPIRSSAIAGWAVSITG